MDHYGRNGNATFSKREELNYSPDESRRPDPRILMQVRKRCVLDSNYPLEAALRNEIYQPLLHLSRIFHLASFEEQCLIICLALEPDKKHEKLYAHIHNEIACKQPSIGLAPDVLFAWLYEEIEARRVFGRSAGGLPYLSDKAGDVELKGGKDRPEGCFLPSPCHSMKEV